MTISTFNIAWEGNFCRGGKTRFKCVQQIGFQLTCLHIKDTVYDGILIYWKDEYPLQYRGLGLCLPCS